MKLRVQRLLIGAGAVAAVTIVSALVLLLLFYSQQSGISEGMQENVGKMDEILGIIQKFNYEDMEEEDLFTGAYRGILWSLDDSYSYYYTAEEMENTNQRNEGNYQGIGVSITVREETQELIITRSFKDSPAQQAGIRIGDVILAVDGVEVSGYTYERALDMIKGEPGTEVILTILSGEDQRDIALIRAEVIQNRVEYRMIGDIAYVEISEFFGDDVEGFKGAIADCLEKGAKGLIVDLRDNQGGLVDHVAEIADILLPGGKIVYTVDRQGEQDVWSSDSDALDLPLAVLVNGLSASASEILAGAVQDHGAGTVIGETTYGKGIVQTRYTLSDGSGIQITTSHYFTPNGRSIHGVGITPDIEVETTEEFRRNRALMDPSEDAPLQKALEVLQAEVNKMQEEAA